MKKQEFLEPDSQNPMGEYDNVLPVMPNNKVKASIRWDEVRKGTLITLLEDTSFPSFGGPKVIPAGQYFICGFWANVCGLAKTKKSINDYVLPAEMLTKFEGITK